MSYLPLLFSMVFTCLIAGGVHQLKTDRQSNSSLPDFLQNSEDSTAKDTVLTYIIEYRHGDSVCLGWKVPSKEMVFPLMYSLQEMDGREWHDCYSDWGCYVTGHLIYKNEKFYYSLNSGGWMIISNESRQLYFGCRNRKECSHYFTDPGYCIYDEDGYHWGE